MKWISISLMSVAAFAECPSSVSDLGALRIILNDFDNGVSCLWKLSKSVSFMPEDPIFTFPLTVAPTALRLAGERTYKKQECGKNGLMNGTSRPFNNLFSHGKLHSSKRFEYTIIHSSECDGNTSDKTHESIRKFSMIPNFPFYISKVTAPHISRDLWLLQFSRPLSVDQVRAVIPPRLAMLDSEDNNGENFESINNDNGGEWLEFESWVYDSDPFDDSEDFFVILPVEEAINLSTLSEENKSVTKRAFVVESSRRRLTASVINSLESSLNNTASNLSSVLGQTGSRLSSIVSNVNNSSSSLTNSLLTNVRSSSSNLIDQTNNLGTNLTLNLGSSLPSTSSLLNNLLATSTTTYQASSGIIDDFLGSIKTVAQNVGNYIAPTVTPLSNVLGNNLRGIELSSLTSYVQNSTLLASSAVNESIDLSNLSALLRNTTESASSSVRSIDLSNLTSLMRNATLDASTSASSILESLSNSAADAANVQLSALTGLGYTLFTLSGVQYVMDNHEVVHRVSSETASLLLDSGLGVASLANGVSDSSVSIGSGYTGTASEGATPGTADGSQFISLSGGAVLRYKVQGSGPIKVISTPRGQTGIEAEIFTSDVLMRVPNWEQYYTVLTWDRRNIGASEVRYASGEESIGESNLQASDLKQLVDLLSFSPAVLVGGSSGTRASLLFAQTNPSDVQGLVLLDPTQGEVAAQVLASNYFSQYIDIVKYGGPTLLKKTAYYSDLVSENSANSDIIDGLDRNVFINHMQTSADQLKSTGSGPILGFSTTAELNAIKSTALVVHTQISNDGMHTAQAAQTLRDSLGSAEDNVVWASGLGTPNAASTWRDDIVNFINVLYI